MNTRIFIWSLSVLILLGFSTTLFSQKNQIKIIAQTKSGIELKGFTNSQQLEENPDSIEFYKNSKDSKIFLTPTNTNWFKVSDKYYISKEINYVKSPRQDDQLSFDNTYPTYSKTAFCLVLAEGPTSLYEYIDEWGTPHYFIEDHNTPIIELVYFKYLMKQETSKESIIVENRKFQGQLSNLFSDCPEIMKESTTSEYSQKDLRNLFESYYNCKSDSNYYIKKNNRVKVRFGLVAGYSFTYIQFINKTKATIPNFETNWSTKPIAGVSLNIIPIKWKGKLNYYAELLLKSHSYSGERNFYKSSSYYYTSEYLFEATYLKLTTLIRYNLNTKKLKPYFAGGLFFAPTIKDKTYGKVDGYYNNNFVNIEGEFYENGAKNIDYGLVAETGLNYNNFNFGVRYDIGATRVYNNMEGFTQSFYAFLSYIF